MSYALQYQKISSTQPCANHQFSFSIGIPQDEAGPLPKKDVNLLENDIFDPLAEDQKPDPPPPPPPSNQAWLPDGDSQLLRSYVFGPTGLKDYGSATLCCKI